MGKTKEMPTGVKIISILDYIGAGLGIIFGLILIFGGRMGAFPFLSSRSGVWKIILGIIVIGIGVLAYFTAKGLWHGKAWARILAIVIAACGAVIAIASLIFMGRAPGQNVVSLIFHGIIGGYLLFNKKVKAAFA
jgi:hypothetical protein